MSIFEMAINKEKQMEKTYWDLAEKTNQPGIKKIMIMLANEEARHTLVLEKMETKMPESYESTLLTTAKDILQTTKHNKDIVDINMDQAEIYRKVRDLEKESESFYLAKADEETISERKKIFLMLSKEEAGHFRLMDEIVEFVARPEKWIENAEFSSLKDNGRTN